MIMCGDDPFKKSAMHKNPVSPKSFGASVGPRERESERERERLSKIIIIIIVYNSLT